MPEVEISREDTGSAAVFRVRPATAPPTRYDHLIYAAILVGAFVAAGEWFNEPASSMLRWLGVLCAVPVLVLWAVTLIRAARQTVVRLSVTEDGLAVFGHTYPHETIRALALYARNSPRPLFRAQLAPVNAKQHKAELELAGGAVPVEDDEAAEAPAKRRRRSVGFRLVMQRRNLPGIVLVRGLTLSGGETLFAALAAELRKHSR